MPTQITPFLMFQDGNAEAAITFYLSVFPDSGIDHISHYAPGMPGPEGKVLQAAFTLAGQSFRASDSPIKHDFEFTPSLSLFVDLPDAAALDHAFKALSEGGQIRMDLADYGFSQRFGWTDDRFGVSWQLNLPF